MCVLYALMSIYLPGCLFLSTNGANAPPIIWKDFYTKGLILNFIFLLSECTQIYVVQRLQTQLPRRVHNTPCDPKTSWLVSVERHGRKKDKPTLSPLPCYTYSQLYSIIKDKNMLMYAYFSLLCCYVLIYCLLRLLQSCIW